MHLFADADHPAIVALLKRFGMELVQIDSGVEIPGSYWGESEAGLLGNRLYVRPDTPLHSLLHEASHFICMDEDRRAGLEKDAGGDYDEENGVCYLQILLADHIPDFDRRAMWADMDSWGYTFRLGSARAWFEQDAQDAQHWLSTHGIVDQDDQLTWRVRSK